MHRSLSDSHWGQTSPHPFLQRDKFRPLSLRTAGPPPPSWALPGCLKDPWLSTCSSPITRLQVILHGICLGSLSLSLSLSVSLCLSLSLSHTHTHTHTHQCKVQALCGQKWIMSGKQVKTKLEDRHGPRLPEAYFNEKDPCKRVNQ